MHPDLTGRPRLRAIVLVEKAALQLAHLVVPFVCCRLAYIGDFQEIHLRVPRDLHGLSAYEKLAVGRCDTSAESTGHKTRRGNPRFLQIANVYAVIAYGKVGKRDAADQPASVFCAQMGSGRHTERLRQKMHAGLCDFAVLHSFLLHIGVDSLGNRAGFL